jgi:hypothetical protein
MHKKHLRYLPQHCPCISCAPYASREPGSRIAFFVPAITVSRRPQLSTLVHPKIILMAPPIKWIAAGVAATLLILGLQANYLQRPVQTQPQELPFAATNTINYCDLCSNGASTESSGLTEATPNDHISTAFSKIYAANSWGKEGGSSGHGSSFKFTRSARLIIELLVFRHGITKFMDIPCGSSHWWPPLFQSIRKRVPCFTYLGMDVVESVISSSKTKYADDPLTNFKVADVSVEPLPKGWDLVLSRDALQHLPMIDAINVIENISKSSPRFLLVGTYMDYAGNRNIVAGDYYDINLTKAPFNMTEPMEVFDEQTPNGDPGKFLLLYSREQLESFDYEAMRTRAKAMLT